MAGLAAFLRLPVTAFAWPEPGGFRARLFAPATELEFSGGGLLAVAHALWRSELVAPSHALGLLTASGAVEAVMAAGEIEVRQGGRALFTAAATGVRTVARGELAWPP